MTVKNRVTDARTPFFMIANAVVDDFKLGPYAGWLYAVIVRHANQKTGESFPGLSRLARLAGMTKPSVIKYLKVLEEKNLVSIRREFDEEKSQHTVNHYYLHDIPGSKPDLQGVVNDVDHPGKPDLQGVVNDVDSNKTHSNKTHSNKTKRGVSDDTHAPKRTREENDFYFEAVKAAFRFDDKTPGALIARYAQFLRGGVPEKKSGRASGEWFDMQPTDPVTLDELPAFRLWLDREHRDLEPLRKPAAIIDYLGRFRATRRPQSPSAPVPPPPIDPDIPDPDELMRRVHEELGIKRS